MLSKLTLYRPAISLINIPRRDISTRRSEFQDNTFIPQLRKIGAEPKLFHTSWTQGFLSKDAMAKNFRVIHDIVDTASKKAVTWAPKFFGRVQGTYFSWKEGHFYVQAQPVIDTDSKATVSSPSLMVDRFMSFPSFRFFVPPGHEIVKLFEKNLSRAEKDALFEKYFDELRKYTLDVMSGKYHVADKTVVIAGYAFIELSDHITVTIDDTVHTFITAKALGPHYVDGVAIHGDSTVPGKDVRMAWVIGAGKAKCSLVDIVNNFVGNQLWETVVDTVPHVRAWRAAGMNGSLLEYIYSKDKSLSLHYLCLQTFMRASWPVRLRQLRGATEYDLTLSTGFSSLLPSIESLGTNVGLDSLNDFTDKSKLKLSTYTNGGAWLGKYQFDAAGIFFPPEFFGTNDTDKKAINAAMAKGLSDQVLQAVKKDVQAFAANYLKSSPDATLDQILYGNEIYQLLYAAVQPIYDQCLTNLDDDSRPRVQEYLDLAYKVLIVYQDGLAGIWISQVKKPGDKDLEKKEAEIIQMLRSGGRKYEDL